MQSVRTTTAAGAAATTTTTDKKISSTFETITSVPCVFVLVTCIKLLLVPSYHSTDFDVHRNWLALTKHVPFSEWYSHDLDGKTRHTLDYPPSFAYFEAILSYILSAFLKIDDHDERCLALLPDTDNEPSPTCILYHRLTVIASDIILFMGAYMASHAVYGFSKTKDNKLKIQFTILLITCHPGLLILDHVHFQYNGMLLGILLASLACVLKGHILLGAALYAILVTMKHLYLTLGPIYLVYIFRQYCLQSVSYDNHQQKSGAKYKNTIIWKQFFLVAAVTATTIIIPFLPFILIPSNHSEGEEPTSSHMIVMKQMMSRLFPFGRGLVHDYWAANVWALYMFGGKCFNFILKKLSMNSFLFIHQWPNIEPSTTAICLLLSLIPAMYVCWNSQSNEHKHTSKTSSQNHPLWQNNLTFLYAIIYAAFSSFMLSWHVHEKAVMTALLPLTLLACTSRDHASWFIRTYLIGIFALFPLLYRPVELLCKLFLYLTYTAVAVYGLEYNIYGGIILPRMSLTPSGIWDILLYLGLISIFIYMECISPLIGDPRLEFLPLLLTSTFCAIVLIYHGWFKSASFMWKNLSK